MSIQLTCACGRSLRVREELAGQQIRCTGCGRTCRVPAWSEGVAPPGPAPQAARRTKRHRPAVMRAGLSPWLWAAGGASAMLVLAACVCLAFVLLHRSPPPSVAGPSPAADPPPVLASAPEPVVEPRPVSSDKAPPSPPASPPVPLPQPPARPEPPVPAPEVPRDVRVQLVRFGRGTIEAAEYAGRPLTGVIVEVEALLPRHAAAFQKASVTALGRDGNEVPACLLFIAGGRDGLDPTARILPHSVGKGWVFSVGSSRFDPPGRTVFGAGVAEVTAELQTTARVQTLPARGTITIGDVLAFLPLDLKTGGIELTFLQNRKVTLVFLFPAAADGLSSLKLMGQTLPLDATRRDDAAPPAGAPGVPSAVRPGRPAAPAVPVSEAAAVLRILPSSELPDGRVIGPSPEERVSVVAFSPDGRFVLGAGGSHWSGSDAMHSEGRAGVWDLQTGKQVPALKTKKPLNLKDRSAGFAAGAFTADGRRVLCATDSRDILIGEVQGNRPARHLDFSRAAANLLCFWPDGRRVLLAAGDNSVRLWDLEPPREIRRYVGHAGNIHWAAVLPDGRRFLTAATDGTVRLWDVAQTRALHRFDADRVSEVALAPRGTRALFIGTRLHLWDLDRWQEVAAPARPQDGIHPAALSPDGRRALFPGPTQYAPDVVRGRLRHTIQLWDLQAGRPLALFTGHEQFVEHLAFSPDGRHFLSGSRDGTMRLWDLPAVDPPVDKPGDAPAKPPAVDGPGEIRSLVVGSAAGFLTPTVAVSRDGKRAVSTTRGDGLAGSLLRVWDLERFEEVRRFKTAGAYGIGVVLAPDGRRALLWAGPFGLPDKALHLWDLDTGREVRALPGHTGAVGCVAFSADGRRAVSGGRSPWKGGMAPPPAEDFAVIVWDVASGRELRRLVGHTAPVHTVAFSPDGRCVLSGSGPTNSGQAGPGVPGAPDNSLRLWDVQTGRELRRFPGHGGPVFCAAFSPDGRHVLSGAGDGLVRLFDAQTGREVRRLEGHTAGVRCVAFSADGHRALSGSGDRDNTVRLWDVDTGQPLHTFHQSGGGIDRLAFHPDGRRAFSVAAGTVSLWRLPAP